MEPKKCPWCGITFTPNIHNQKWCSKSCKNKAYEHRKKQRNSEKILPDDKLLEKTILEIATMGLTPTVVNTLLKRKFDLEDKSSIKVDKQEEELNIDFELVKQFGDFLAKKIKPQADSEA